jgi:hypothetical protein
MQRQSRRIAATLVALTLGLTPALAGEFDPRGRWQTTTGESRYDFAFCSSDASKLCASLQWLNAAGMQTPARKQLGTDAYTNASHVGPNTWRGVLSYNGLSTQATVTLASSHKLTISGCYLIWCRSFDLVKISR